MFRAALGTLVGHRGIAPVHHHQDPLVDTNERLHSSGEEKQAIEQLTHNDCISVLILPSGSLLNPTPTIPCPELETTQCLARPPCAARCSNSELGSIRCHAPRLGWQCLSPIRKFRDVLDVSQSSTK